MELREWEWNKSLIWKFKALSLLLHVFTREDWNDCWWNTNFGCSVLALYPGQVRREKGYPLFAHVHTTLWFHGVLYSIVNKLFIFSVTQTSASQLISPIWKMSATNHALLKRWWGGSMVNPEHWNSQNKQKLGAWSGNGCAHLKDQNESTR